MCQIYFPDTLFLLIFARLPDNIQHTLQLGSLCRSLSIVNMLPVFFEFSKQMFSRILGPFNRKISALLRFVIPCKIYTEKELLQRWK